MEYLDLEPSIDAYYFRIQTNDIGEPVFVKCRAFDADIEIAVGKSVNAKSYEVIEVSSR